MSKVFASSLFRNKKVHVLVARSEALGETQDKLVIEALFVHRQPLKICVRHTSLPKLCFVCPVLLLYDSY